MQALQNIAVLQGSSRRMFTPDMLFAAGETGLWYDPSDLTTLYQDAAGTTPVTALEQPVGKILDKSGRGNHATQSTSAARPTVSARVNLLTYSEAFDNAVWLKSQCTIAASGIADPFGGTNAQEIQFTNVSGSCYRAVGSKPAIVASTDYVHSVWLRAKTGTFKLKLSRTNGASWTGSTVSSEITLTTTWTRYTLPITTGGTDTQSDFVIGAESKTPYSLPATGSIYVYGADIRSANQAAALPLYQRVAAATDYTSSGFPSFLRFDGVDDFLVTDNLTLSSDKAALITALRKMTDASRGIVAELSADSSANNGTFYLEHGENHYEYSAIARGTAAANVTQEAKIDSATYAAPHTGLITTLHDISGPSSALRINGTLVNTATGNKGSGNFGTYPMYLGMRAGTSLAFRGNLYGCILRGGALTTEQISAAENWLNQKAQVY